MRQTLDEDYLSKICKRNVLSVDVAEHCGYYSTHGYGTWYFPPTEKASKKKYGGDYEQHRQFYLTIKNFIIEHDIKVVAAEDVNVGTRFMALRKLSEFRGVLFALCAELNIPLVFFNVTNIKRWATGDGRADKKKMMEYAIKRWHIDPEGDDNVGDACHIFFYFIHRYEITK